MFPSKLFTGVILAAASALACAAQTPDTATTATVPPPAAPQPAPVLVPPVPGGQGAAPGVPSATPAAANPQADDETFLLLREAARQDDAAKANALASRLPNYGIPSYVDYYRLKPRLREAQEDEIRAFLKRWDGSAIADRLRNDWLLELGRRRDWATFDRELPLFVKDDDYQVKCYALLSRLAKGENVASPARQLLNNPAGYGEACTALLAQLAQASSPRPTCSRSCAWPAK
jgi:soluble lytic murein transglycosylase